MRQIYKQWKTPKGKEFTHRVRWYQESSGLNIRLQLETPEGLKNIYPKSKQEAEYEFNKFRAEYEFPADPKPTAEEWETGYDAAIEAGQTSISRAEAMKRFHKEHPEDNGYSEPYN